MTRTALLLPLALLGLTSTAFAGIDDVAASMLDGHELDSAQMDDLQARTTTTKTKTKGNKTATRQTATNRSGSKKAQRVTYSNGSKSHSKGRARSTTQSRQGSASANGNRHGRTNTTTKLRGYKTTSNGTKSVTQKRGVNKNTSVRHGVQNGQSYRHTTSSGTKRSQTTLNNNRTGRTIQNESRTRGASSHGRAGGVKSTQRTTRTTDTRSNARPNAIPGPSRRGTTTVRPSGPSRTTVVTRPAGRRTTTVVRPATRGTRVTTVRQPRTTVVHRRTTTYHAVRPYHGVFVYGPAPTHHHHYQSGQPAQVRNTHMPDRTLDRANSVAVGLKMGSLTSGYDNGSIYGDLGVGLAGRYRPAESVGLQLDLTHHAQSWGPNTERSQTVAAGSVQLFAFPWTRVQPYAIGGVTYDARNIQDDIYRGDTTATVIANDSLWGLHGGLGVELAMGKSLALDLEGRYIGYLDKSPTDPSLPGAFQFTGGLMVHF